MRKYFEDHSLTGVVIIFCAFALAVFLRFFDLSDQSPWTDEIASWWYLRHLDTVFFRESHTPLFYGLLRFFLGPDATISGIRHFVAAISVIHLIEFFFLGQMALKKRAFLLFWVFVCLNPADIVHARMARQYAWLLEGSLVYFLLWKIDAKHWLRILTGTFTAFIHVFAVIPIAVLAGYDFYRNRKWRDLVWSLIPCALVSLYYLSRIITLGGDKVVSNISWAKSTFQTFITLTATQFLGDSFPRFEFYPVSFVLASVVVGASLVLFLFYRKPGARAFLLIAVASVVVVELLMPWANFRVSRYVIYLSGIWLYATAESLENVKDYFFYPVIVLPLLYIVSFNPLLKYPWERESVEAWEKFRKSDPASQYVVCANDYQNEFHGFGQRVDCASGISMVDTSRPFLFFDLNSTNTYLAAHFLRTMDISEYFPLDSGGLIVKFIPKKKASKNEK